MPLRLTTEKEYQGEFWTNVYWLDHETVAAALADGLAIIQAEQAASAAAVLFTRYRVDDAVIETDNYQTVIVNQYGAVAADGNQLMPLFACLRVDFTVSGGRPSRKYFRGMLYESNVDGPFNLVPAFVTARQADLATNIAAVASYVDVDGQEITGGLVYPKVAMRQLRRGSKKKDTQSTPTP